MNRTPSSGFDASFLDEEEKGIVTSFEAAIEDGRILPQSISEQETARTEWQSILENTLQN